MPGLIVLVKMGLYVVMTLTVAAAIGVVTLPNLFHAALALVVTLVGIAAIYLGLQADFLAVVQILLYVGAVMTLVIFTVMLTERLGDKTIAQKNRLGFPALAGGIIFLVAHWRILLKTPWPIKGTPNPPTSTWELGKAFMSNYVFPFEVISIVLIVALIGAVVIAQKEKES